MIFGAANFFKEDNEQKIIDYLKDFRYNSKNCENDLIVKDAL